MLLFEWLEGKRNAQGTGRYIWAMGYPNLQLADLQTHHCCSAMKVHMPLINPKRDFENNQNENTVNPCILFLWMMARMGLADCFAKLLTHESEPSLKPCVTRF